MARRSVIAVMVAAGVFAGAASAAEPPTRPPEELWRAFPLDDRPGKEPAPPPREQTPSPNSSAGTKTPTRPASTVPAASPVVSTPRPAPTSTRAAEPVDGGAAADDSTRLILAAGLAALLLIAAGVAFVAWRRRGPERLGAAVRDVRDRLDDARAAAGDAVADLQARVIDGKDAVFDPVSVRVGAVRAALTDRVYELRMRLSNRLAAILDSLRGRGSRRRGLRPAFAYHGDAGARPSREQRRRDAPTAPPEGRPPEPEPDAERTPDVEREVEAQTASAPPAPSPAPPAAPPLRPLDAIDEALARAHAERIALSVAVPRAPSGGALDRFVATLAGDEAARRVGPYVVLAGVTPKRAAELAAAAIEGEASTPADLVVGIAGAPRHGRSAGELVRLAERAAVHAAASETRVCVAELSWRDDE